MKTVRALLRLVAATLLLAPVAGASLAEDLAQSAVLGASIRPGWRTTDGTQIAAFDLRLAPGWKTYWRAPGEAGIPPSFDWSGSENVAGVDYLWPRPHVFDLNGLRTIGYKGGLLLPIAVRVADPQRPALIKGRVELGVCDEICVPVTLTLSATLPAGGDKDPQIQSALDDQPTTGRKAGIPKPRCTAEPLRDGLRLTTRIAVAATTRPEFAVVEIDGRPVWSQEVKTLVEDGTTTQITDLIPPDAAPFALERSAVRTTLFLKDGGIIEFSGCTG